MGAAPPPCPTNWEYENFPDARKTVNARAKALLAIIVSGSNYDRLTAAQDTRPLHRQLFEGLTPTGFDYFAGHYRGENLWCLDRYEVKVKSDRRVGHTAATVPIEMEAFSRRIQQSLQLIEYHLSVPSPTLSDATKLVLFVQLAAALFVDFLEIHPFANGNGHMGRLILLAVMARRDYFPSDAWRIDPRPKDPPYSNLISRYRDGDRDPLVQFIIDAL